jgi:uncharacterized protein YdcH (DUF465 family)
MSDKFEVSFGSSNISENPMSRAYQELVDQVHNLESRLKVQAQMTEKLSKRIKMLEGQAAERASEDAMKYVRVKDEANPNLHHLDENERAVEGVCKTTRMPCQRCVAARDGARLDCRWAFTGRAGHYNRVQQVQENQ